MINIVRNYILEKLKDVYGEDYVEICDGKIFVDDEDSNCGCVIEVDYTT